MRVELDLEHGSGYVRGVEKRPDPSGRTLMSDPAVVFGMVDRRQAGLLFAGMAIALLLVWTAGFGFSSPGVGTIVRLDGEIDTVSPEHGWLTVTTSSLPEETVRVAVTARTSVYACEPDDLAVCDPRSSLSWVTPGTQVCIEALVRDRGPPLASTVYVDTPCRSAPTTPPD